MRTPRHLTAAGLIALVSLAVPPRQARGLDTPDDTIPCAIGVRFEENLGQTHQDVRFLSRGGGHVVFLTRQALVLKQYHDLSYQEIADAMESTVASVQMLLHRAMNALRKDLGSRSVER